MYSQNGSIQSTEQTNQSSALPQAQQSSSYNQGYATYSNQLSTQPGQSVQQTQSQQSTQQPQSLPSTQQPLHSGAMIAPYIPVVQANTKDDKKSYILPSSEIQKMLQQNAMIIRKFISDVKSGKQIDVTEYSGLHTSVYLLSLFTAQKNNSGVRAGIPVSKYQALIKKMVQVKMQVQNKQ